LALVYESQDTGKNCARWMVQIILLPGKIEHYHNFLEDAYAAYGKVEMVVDELSQQLEGGEKGSDALEIQLEE